MSESRYQNCAIIIPACNEEETIFSIVEHSKQIVDLVIVVDDGSTDSTGKIARSAGGNVVAHEAQSGLGQALHTGIREVVSRGYANVVTLDADGAHDPTDVARLLDAHVKQMASLTVGSRFRTNDHSQVFPSTKLDANRFASCLLHVSTGTPKVDVASGLRAISTTFAQELQLCPDYGVSYELVCMCHARGERIATVPISVHYDAFDPFATRQSELLALLRIASEYSKNQGIADRLTSLSRLARKWKKLLVGVDGERFVLHPIPDMCAYLIQRQDSAFLGRVDPNFQLIKVGGD